jgi:ribonuclease HII
MGLNDSKKIKEEKREKLFELIKHSEGKFFNAMISAKEIDKKGIAKCMQILIKKLLVKTETSKTHYLLDGAIKFPENISHEVIIKGDSKEPTIMAGSIVAKVSRDRVMRKLAKRYTQYGFEIHKGYGTLKHRKAIKKFGLSEIHRKSFCKNI